MEAREGTRRFVKRFGVLACMYASCDVIGIVVCELFLPRYLQQETMVGISDIAHLVVNAALVFVFGRGGFGYEEVRVKE